MLISSIILLASSLMMMLGGLTAYLVLSNLDK